MFETLFIFVYGLIVGDVDILQTNKTFYLDYLKYQEKSDRSIAIWIFFDKV